MTDFTYTAEIATLANAAAGSGSLVTVNAGSTFQVNDNLIVGVTTNTNNNILRATGAGASIVGNTGSTGQGVRIGNNANSGNRIEVLNGASFTIDSVTAGTNALRVDSGTAGSDNALLISGAGSSFSNTTSANITAGQNDADSQNNAIIVTDGATFSSDGAVRVLGLTGSNNSFTISDGAVANFNATTGNNFGGSSTLTIDNAELNAGNLWVNISTATMQVLDGAEVTVTNSLRFGNNAVLELDVGSDFQTISVGLLEADGSSILLNINEITGFGTYTLINATGIGSDFDAFTLNSVPEGFEDSFLTSDANNLYLNAIPEPGTYALLFGGLALGLVWFRRAGK